MTTNKHTNYTSFESFCDVFGARADIAAEIHAYWAAGGSPFPDKVYEHLVKARTSENRKLKGRISPQRAKFLIAYFKENFAPEPVTGYIPKHREPLITAFARAYAESQEQRHIYRVEADIMNLGGLNKAIKHAMGKGHEVEAKQLANRIIHTMTSIVKSNLEKVDPTGHICAIRKGGDELTIYVSPQPTTDPARVKAALEQAEIEMAAFVNAAGLRELAHLKHDRPNGIGIGCGYADLRDEHGKLRTEVALLSMLEDTIEEKAKPDFQKKLGGSRPEPIPGGEVVANVGAGRDGRSNFRTYKSKAPRISSVPKLAHIVSVLDSEPYRTHSTLAAVADSMLAQDRHFSGGATPDEARKLRISRNYPTDFTDPNYEEKLLGDTVKLTDKLDHVTGQPLFSTIQQVIVPFFCEKHKTSEARVIHIDFNNMGGGNKLGTWVGDAMAREFAECIIEELESKGLDQFKHFLTSQGGGKFTLLLPVSSKKEKSDNAGDEHDELAEDFDASFVERFTAAIEKRLVERSTKALPLEPDQFAATKRRILKIAKEKLALRKDGWTEGDKQRPIQVNPDSICIADIDNTKGRRQGSHIVTLSSVIDFNKTTVKDEIDRLEDKTRKGHDAIEDYDHRRALRKKMAPQELPPAAEAGQPNTGVARPNHEKMGRKNWVMKVTQVDPPTTPQK